MSVNTKSAGFTTVEILVAIVVGGIILSTFFVFSFTVLSSTVRNQNEVQMAVESETILRSLTEELRISSGVRTNNTIEDPNKPDGWTTSNPDIVLIVSTPALDTSGSFIKNESEGNLYQNEVIYYADGTNLSKRILAAPGAPNNRTRTSCPTSTPTCPQDILLSEHFESMSFIFFDQDDAVTTDALQARSILITISLEKSGYSQTSRFTNTVRVTMRNNTL